MALTVEQQAEVDLENAKESGRQSHELAMEARRTRMEALRMARDVLTENRRSEPADSRALTADDITTFANSLLAYVHA